MDRQWLSGAKRELDYLLTCDELGSVSVLVLGNKIGDPTAASVKTTSATSLASSLGTYGKDTSRYRARRQ